MRKRTRTVSAALALAVMTPTASASGGGAEVIYYGRVHAPGVRAEVIAVATDRSGESASARARSASPSVAMAKPSGSVAVPAPVAISAHNCIPRTDARGISLSFEFAEGTAADCLSFVSPDPVPPAPRRDARRGRRPSPESLAQAAYDRMISLAPEPDLALAPGRVGLTGLPSFFWVGNELRPVSATAGVRGLTVTAEARPVRYLWDFDDGAGRRTTHPGRPWTRHREGDVSHLYETKGRYDVSVEVVWAARWRVNDGAWRGLGYFSTTDSVDYPVRGMIAVLVGRR